MPIFHYEAVEASGKKFSGIINADSLISAKEQLRKQQVLVTKLFSERKKGKKLALAKSELLAFTRDLAQLLNAGLPLYESLVTIEEKYARTKSHEIYLALCDKVKHGAQLSSALADFPDTFGQIYVAMVAAAEETGALASVFEQLEGLIFRGQKLRKQLTSALIYPIFLLSFCFVVVFALFFFLIPSMQQLFEGRDLHPMTEAVIGLSRSLRSNGAMLGVVTATVVVGCVIFFRRPEGKKVWSRFVMSVAVFRRGVTAAVMARFCRSLSVLLSSSVSMVEALRYSRKVINQVDFEEAVERAEENIVKGGKLSSELARSSLIPAMVTRMLAIGEEAGNTSSMLQSIADIYEEELEKTLSRVTSMLQPVILLILAVIVGVVILSVLLPLTDVSSFVG